MGTAPAGCRFLPPDSVIAASGKLLMKEVPDMPGENMNAGIAGLPDGAESLLRTVLNLCDFGICLVNRGGDVLLANQTLTDWLQQSTSDWHGRSIWDFIPAAQRPRVRDRIAAFVGGEAPEASIVCQLEIGKQGIPVEFQIFAAESEPDTILAIAFRRIAPEPAPPILDSNTSRTDPLTGLPDRTFLIERLTSQLGRAGLGMSRLAVLFIDIDDFKQVNDRFGHLVGDQVLREAAQRLAVCVRSGDYVARFGGDEFVVLVGGIGGGAVRPIIDRIRAAFLRPFALPEGELTLSVSIGVSEPDSECTTADDLLRVADQAMYAAKREKH
jgi:diguanylate cyclase (GGDEF)-like protein